MFATNFAVDPESTYMCHKNASAAFPSVHQQILITILRYDYEALR